MIRRAFPWRGASWPPPFWARCAAPWWARTRYWQRCCWPFWPGPHPAGGHSRRGQDHHGPGLLQGPEPPVQPGPVHPRRDAVGHHGLHPLQQGRRAGWSTSPARCCATSFGRRAQPGHQPHPVRPAGGHGGGAGDGGWGVPPGAPALPGHRHPEPGGGLRHPASARLPRWTGSWCACPSATPAPADEMAMVRRRQGAHSWEGCARCWSSTACSPCGPRPDRSTYPTRCWTTSCAWWAPPGATP